MPADATVGFAESAVNITEGELLEVCLELSNVPEGGVACDITATLAALPSLYGKQGTILDIDTCVVKRKICVLISWPALKMNFPVYSIYSILLLLLHLQRLLCACITRSIICSWYYVSQKL